MIGKSIEFLFITFGLTMATSFIVAVIIRAIAVIVQKKSKGNATESK